MGGGSKGGATNRLAAAPESSALARVDPSPRLLWQPVTHAPAFTPPSLLPSSPPPPSRLARCHVLAAQSPAFQRFQSARRGASVAEWHAGRPVKQRMREKGEEIDAFFFFFGLFLSPPSLPPGPRTAAPPPPFTPDVSEQRGKLIRLPLLRLCSHRSIGGLTRGEEEEVEGSQGCLFPAVPFSCHRRSLLAGLPVHPPAGILSPPGRGFDARRRCRGPPPPQSLFPVSPVARKGGG